MIIKECNHCKKEFKVFPYRKDTAICCSRSCLAYYKIKKYGHISTTHKWTNPDSFKLKAKNRMKGNKRGFKKGMTPWNKGKDWVEMSGENHPGWKGGVKQRYECKSTEIRSWAKDIYKRDWYSCQFCGKRCDKDIQAHHIKAWRENKEARFSPDNGITLCFKCHLKTRNKEKYYEDICNNLLKVKTMPNYYKNIIKFALP